MTTPALNIAPWRRLRALRRRITAQGFVHLLKAHSGLSRIVAEASGWSERAGSSNVTVCVRVAVRYRRASRIPRSSASNPDFRPPTNDKIPILTSNPLVLDRTGGKRGEPS
jgi:hypothetical protein